MFFRRSSLIRALILFPVFFFYSLAVGIISAPASLHGVETSASNQGKETFLHYFEAAQHSVRQDSVLSWGGEINVQKECQFLTGWEPAPVFCLRLYQKEQISGRGPALVIAYKLIGFYETQDHWGEEIALIKIRRDVSDVGCKNNSCSKLWFIFSDWYLDSIEWMVPDQPEGF